MADRDRPPSERPSGGKPRGAGQRGGKPGGKPGGRPGGKPYSPRPPGAGKPGGSYERADGPRPAGSHPAGSRPPEHRPPSDRPLREYGAGSDRPQRSYQPRSERGRYEKPGQDRPAYDRPRHDRPRYDESAPFDRGPGDHAQTQDRPWQDRPPQKRPSHERPRPEGRPYDRNRRPFDARRPYTARPAYSVRPHHEPPVDRDALVGETDELIAGRRPVEEAFAARRDAVRLLIVPERRAALDALAIHATTLRIPVVEVEGGTLTALAGFDGHQGVALVAKPRPAGDVESILARARERGEPPFVLVLDSLEDPQNFGTLLRSAEACGVHGVIYPTRRAAPLSPAAIKASAGATEHLVLAAVEDLAGTLADLHGGGLRLVGADEGASLSYADADLRGPLAIVVGSEGRGMSGPVRRRLDLAVRIPMRGKIESLNAAVAGSILLFAAAGQRPEPAQRDDVDRPRPEPPKPQPDAVDPAEVEAAVESEPHETEELLPDDG